MSSFVLRVVGRRNGKREEKEILFRLVYTLELNLLKKKKIESCLNTRSNSSRHLIVSFIQRL